MATICRLTTQQLQRRAYWTSRDSFKRSQQVARNNLTPVILQCADRNPDRLSPTTLLYTNNQDASHLLQSAQYLQNELLVRLAHRIVGFQQLPFVVSTQPSILQVHELYLRSFKLLYEFRLIETLDDDIEYTKLLRRLLDDHRDVITNLADGFKQCRRYIKDRSIVQTFLDQMLTSRLGIRILAEHHAALHDHVDGFIGIIDKEFRPKNLIKRKASEIRQMCEHRYGIAPKLKWSGHVLRSGRAVRQVDCCFPFIPMPLDYILGELFKNSFRATVEVHRDKRSELPEVLVTIATTPYNCTIKISDSGGGLPPHVLNRVWDYHFTTSPSEMGGLGADESGDVDAAGMSPSLLSGAFGASQRFGVFGRMHGFGFGVPSCCAYAKFLGGDLQLLSCDGIGTDVYLKFKRFDGDMESFLI